VIRAGIIGLLPLVTACGPEQANFFSRFFNS
jgi:hypothetical protein